MHFTWIQTGRNPERWSLGILRAGRLDRICAEVERFDGGWLWQRWWTLGVLRMKRCEHEGGTAPTLHEAKQAAGWDLGRRQEGVYA